MDFLLQQTLNALQWGSFYALIALGYTLVYGVLRLINFAHGDIFMSVLDNICVSQYHRLGYKLLDVWLNNERYGREESRVRQKATKILEIMMLTKCLRELEDYGLVHRQQYNEVPPRVEYSLTERGKQLLPALGALYAWGRDQMEFERTARTTISDP